MPNTAAASLPPIPFLLYPSHCSSERSLVSTRTSGRYASFDVVISYRFPTGSPAIKWGSTPAGSDRAYPSRFCGELVCGVFVRAFVFSFHTWVIPPFIDILKASRRLGKKIARKDPIHFWLAPHGHRMANVLPRNRGYIPL